MKNYLFKTLSGMLFLSLLPYLSLGDGTKQYKFNNNEGSPATDIHIKMSPAGTFVVPNPNPNNDATTQTPSGTFPTGNGSGTNNINLCNDMSGNPVPNGGSVTLTFGYSGSVPDVQEWWWTNDNNLDPSNGQLGNKKFPAKGTFNFVSATSAGDGSIELGGDAMTATFAMPQGLSGFDMANLFAQFIQDQVPFLGVSSITQSPEATQVVVFPTVFGNEQYDFTAVVNPDSSQAVTFAYQQPINVIPTLSEWGLIILGLILLTIGSVYLIRRRKLAPVIHS